MRFPFALAGLLVLWLMLNQTLSLGQMLLGLAVAALGAWTLRLLHFPAGSVRRFGAALRLTTLVLADVIRSNFAVARIVLGRSRGVTSGFVRIPLELRDPYGLATLACIITATPGTLWVAFDEAGGTLTIHVLDLIDDADWIRTIKGRYERHLLEIYR